MFVTVRINKFNSEIIKKVLDLRPLFSATKRSYTTESDFLKCYSDNGGFNGNYEPLNEHDYTRFYSKRALRREPALTREMTNMAYRVGKQMISLAEGMPNEEVFPFTKIDIGMKEGGSFLLEGAELSAALQYLPSQGLPALLEELRSLQQYLHRPPGPARDILVTNGGQHGIYQCVDLLMEDGDPVIVNEYAYTGAHSTLRPYHPEILGIPEDEHGMIPETLESVLSERLARGLKMPKMMYLIPTGSNPSGTVIPEDRRRMIYELACRYDFLIVEDDPYMFLNYSDKPIASFLSLDSCGRVLRLDSFSKVVSAGLRAGWLTAPAALTRRLELHTQAELLHPCTLSQVILLRLLRNREALVSYLSTARDIYRRRRDALHEALQEVGELADWTMPDAGLFFWLRVRGVDDVYNMAFRTALDKGLMIVPGQAFAFCGRAPCTHLRLTFSRVRYQDMPAAVARLADVIRDEQRLALEQPKRLATER